MFELKTEEARVRDSQMSTHQAWDLLSIPSTWTEINTNNKEVNTIPEVGPLNRSKLVDAGIASPIMLLGKYMFFRKNPSIFTEWLMDDRYTSFQCYQTCKDHISKNG
ncbi:MAG: hypothetical protein Sylvanvirus10_6 [Sylvanvirus sp.]|uniref:Uncharacterized protein n=1 Tax=Sylvanvirus sp. TaxID=2487774 RepID=A0A3G5ALF7_9VIRU|nr:MAG: hypothetical protein Sylvanvirus10_6 [Sylvanvirus sp.]